ncbi:MAG TPA: hypothetical protein VJ617_12345 [Arthrobacter sp.]|nr:hypothetical protein [Arthrobacter sp.]
MQNPFRPTAGATPPELVGGQACWTSFTGSRGIGKTVMLSEAEGIARDHGWAVISRPRHLPAAPRRISISPDLNDEAAEATEGTPS